MADTWRDAPDHSSSGKTQLQTTMRSHPTPVRRAKIQNTRNSKCRWGCEEKKSILALWAGRQTGTTTVENSKELLEKVKNRNTTLQRFFRLEPGRCRREEKGGSCCARSFLKKGEFPPEYSALCIFSDCQWYRVDLLLQLGFYYAVDWYLFTRRVNYFEMLYLW